MFILNALRLNSKKSRLKVKIPKKLHYLLFCTIFLCAGLGAWGVDYTWTGAAGAAWEAAGNWTPNGIPGNTADVVSVPVSTNFPVINADVTIASLTVATGASLTVDADGDLAVSGSLTNSGEITVDGRILVTGTLTNSGKITISSIYSKTSTVGTLDNTSTADDALMVNGYLWVTTVTNSGGIVVVANGVLDVVTNLTTSNKITTNGTLNIQGTLDNSGSLTGGSAGVINITAAQVTLTGTIDTTGKINRTTTTGTTIIDTAILIKAGEISFGGAVTLGVDVTIETTATDGISFADVINGEKALALTATNGTVTLGGAVGASTALAKLTVTTGTTIINTTSIKAGEVSFGGEVMLGADVTIETTATGTGNITFDSTINGAQSLTLNAAGMIKFTRAVGVSTDLANLTVTATSAINIYSSVVTTGTQSFTARAQGVRLLGNTSATNRNWTASASAITLVDTDLYFDHSGDTINLGSDLRCQNLYFYRGNLATSKTITTSKDFVVFGTDYTPNDGGWAGADTRHAYFGAGSLEYYPGGGEYEVGLFKNGAGGTKIDTNAAFTNLTNAVINIVDGNFYNNGANMNAGAFTLNIPANTQTHATTNITDMVTERQWGVPYAVAFNMTVANSTANSTASSGWVTAASGVTGQNVTDGTGNSNWQFARPIIQTAHTVSDDVIYIEFNMPIENGSGEIRTIFTTALSADADADAGAGGVWYKELTRQFFGTTDGAFSNEACTDPLTNTTNPTSFYIRTTNGTWNTDATGTSDGATQSTDRERDHKDIKADLSFLKGVFYAAEGKTMNRAYGVKDVSEGSFTGTTDKCKPVLIGVYTGQEMHGDPGTTPSTNLKTYDAHNFIEFQYSEPVNIGNADLDGTANNTNIRANATLGDIPDSTSGLNIAGLATIANGAISTGSRDSDTSVHSLYRNFSLTPTITAVADQTHRVRVSIAGYVSGTLPIDGEDNHNWIGYIDSATLPSGRVTPVAGVTDKAVNALGDPAYHDLDTTVKPTVNTFPLVNPLVNPLPTDGLYTLWDTLPPVFAKYSIDTTTWIDPENNEKEITGYSSTNWMQKVEFHFFDNTPTYQADEQFQWDSGIGWTTITDSFNDTYGGSRFNPNPAPTNRTKGGIRASSVVGSIDAFNIQIDGERMEIDSTNFKQKLNNTDLFGSSGGGVDTPYLSLNLTSTTRYLLNTHFIIKYNENGNTGFVTDLAGNRMKTDILAEALDTPRIILTVAPVGMSEMYILFSAQMDTSAESLIMIPKNLKITNFADFDLIVDVNVPARVATNTSYGTGFIITLDREVTYADITASSGTGTSTATITNNFTIVYPPPMGIQGIKRKGGGVYALGQATPLSTFGINVVNPLYAYDNKFLDDDAPGFQGENLFAEGELAVRLFDGSGSSGNSVLAGENITLGLTSVVPSTDNAIMILGTNPSPDSISTEFNKITGLNTRVWVPRPSVIPAISSDANTSPVKRLPNLEFPQFIEAPTTDIPFPALGFNAGDRVEFLFQIDGKTIDHDNDGTTANPTPHIPFYVLRLKDPLDPSSIDLWSLDLLDIVQQRGNVTILNNVINTNVGEKTRIEINMPSAGNLTVQVLTIDGNVVKSLHRGRAEEGLRYYTWDGTNNSGDSVARGMYFVRVVGPGIDETRKVMAIKE